MNLSTSPLVPERNAVIQRVGIVFLLEDDDADGAAITPDRLRDFLTVFDARSIPANQEDSFGRMWGSWSFNPMMRK